MKYLGEIAVCLAGGLMLNISAHADNNIAPNNPYVPIVVRNVFGLNPPPTNAPPSTDDTPLKITPNGIMSIFGQLQVLFKVAPKAGQPGAKEESYVLSEGQAQDDIEVTHIDEKAGIVTFNNHGTVQELPLANAPALNTPMPGPGPGGIPSPGGIPARFGAGRPGGAPNVPGGRFGGQPGGAGSSPGLNSIPTRGGNSGGQSITPQTQNTITPEDQMLLIAAQHLKAQQEGDPIAPLFPPTELDADAGIINTPSAPGSPSTTR